MFAGCSMVDECFMGDFRSYLLRKIITYMIRTVLMTAYTLCTRASTPQLCTCIQHLHNVNTIICTVQITYVIISPSFEVYFVPKARETNGCIVLLKTQFQHIKNGFFLEII